MAIVQRNVSPDQSGGGLTELAWNHTIAAGADRILLLHMHEFRPSADPPPVPTFDGVDMTLVDVESQGSQVDSLWYMLNPPVGTFEVAFSSASGEKMGISVDYTGVDQSTPVDGIQTAQQTTATPTLNVVTRVGDRAIWVYGFFDNAPFSADQDEINQIPGGGGIDDVGMSSAEGPTPVTVSWTNGVITTKTIVVCNLRQSVGGPPPQTTLPAVQVADWQLPQAQVVLGGVSRQPATQVASWVVPQNTVNQGPANQTTSPAVQVAAWVVPQVGVSAPGAPQTATPATQVAEWVIPVTQTTVGPISRVMTAQVASWVVPQVSTGEVPPPQTTTPVAVVATWVVPQALVQLGEVIRSPTTQVATWVTPDSIANLEGSPQTRVMTVQVSHWRVPQVVLDQSTFPAVQVATWVVPQAQVLLGEVTRSPASQIGTWIVPQVLVILGGITRLPAAQVAAWIVPQVGVRFDQFASQATQVATWRVPQVKVILPGLFIPGMPKEFTSVKTGSYTSRKGDNYVSL